MSSYQKMIEENLHQPTEQGTNINWNVVRMLNVKYLVSLEQISSRHLRGVGQDPDTQWILYQVTDHLPRAWMVYDIRVEPDIARQRILLNQPDFNPAQEAIADSDILPPGTSTGENSVEVTRFDANRMDLTVNTEHPGLLVISENYIPIWWHAYLNGEKVPIHKVNTIQRGIAIPAGTHQVSLQIQAPVFHASIVSANVLIWLVHVGIAILLIGKSDLSDRFKKARA